MNLICLSLSHPARLSQQPLLHVKAYTTSFVVLTVAKGRQIHVVIAEVVVATGVTDAHVGIFVAQRSVGSRLHGARFPLLASLRDSDLPVFLPELGHTNLEE